MHRETRDGQGCALRLARDAPKFKETTGEEGADPTVSPVQGTGPVLAFKGKFRMKTFATSLFQFAGNVEVVDQTGLSGLYDLSFTFALGGRGAAPAGDPAAAPTGGRGGGGVVRRACDPNFSKALEDQLGLILQPAIVPTEFIVVDHIEKPTEN
jgi:uncharacterized protein (TIGR03435 family)